MRITRSMSFVVKQMTKTIVRKTVLVSFGVMVLAGGVIAGQNILTNPKIAQAATTPESCFAFDAGTGTITDYYNNEGNNVANPACPRDVEIPGTIGGVSVTRITGPNSYSGAFQSSLLTAVTIPSSVTSIGDDAFRWNQINSITIPSSVTNIGSGAFNGNRLTGVAIPNSITSIGESVFARNQLASVTIPSSVTSIGALAFSYNQLTSITIPSGVTSIGDAAFSSNQLTDVSIPSNVANIGISAFSNNPLTSAVFEGAVSVFGAGIFKNSLLTSINYEGTTYTDTDPVSEQCYVFNAGTITDYLLLDMNVIKDSGVGCLSRDLDIPSTIGGEAVVRIGDYSFNWSQLTSVTIPDSVVSVGSDAFSSNNLSTIYIPSSVTSIGDEAFRNNQLTDVIFSNPSSLVSIDEYAFYGNKLTSVSVPSSVESIETTAFVLQTPWGGGIEDSDTSEAPYLWSSDPDEVKELYDNIWYAQLYTEDPSNPNNLVSGLMSEDWWSGWDYNGNGTTLDSLGGHLINPAQVETKYVSSTGSQLSEPETLTGRLEDGSPLRSYHVTESAIPAPLDPYDITPEEQAVMDAGFAQYYRVGNEVTLEAPTSLSGLSLLTPDSPHTLTLSQATNTVNFVYGTPLSYIDFTTPVGSSTNPTKDSVPSSATPLLAKSTFSVDDTKACKQITSASLVEASSFYVPDGTTGQDTLGGLSFTIDCTTPGGEAEVSFSLGGLVSDLSGVRVYKQDSTHNVTDITNQVSLTNNQTPDGTRTTISYSITDGQTLDDDKLVNGAIVDPIYLTIPSEAEVSLVGVPNTGLPRTDITTGTNTTTTATNQTTNNLLALVAASLVTVVLVGVRGALYIRKSRL